MCNILVVGDDRGLFSTITEALNPNVNNHKVKEVSSKKAALREIDRTVFDFIIAETKVLEDDGTKILRETAGKNSALIEIIDKYSVVSAFTPSEKLDYDIIVKPLIATELKIRADRIMQLRKLMYEVTYLRHTQDVIYNCEDIIGEGAKIKKVLSLVKKVARSNATVLITGETGTGKELIAGAIHFNSERRDNSFVKINCAALPESILESELFGHEKGAFTGADKQRVGRFEQANGGTIFLDEIGDMSLSIQAKILRVLQEKEFERLGGTKIIKVDIRLITATNKDLLLEVRENRFREDLYYRLNVINIDLPSLRERREDIPLLAGFFLHKYRGNLKKEAASFAPEAMEAMLKHSWPGNIRELENAVERAVLMAEGREIGVDDLFLGDRLPAGGEEENSPIKPNLEKATLKENEKKMILEALEGSNWVQKNAALKLGISKRVMHYKIKNYGITSPRWIKNK